MRLVGLSTTCVLSQLPERTCLEPVQSPCCSHIQLLSAPLLLSDVDEVESGVEESEYANENASRDASRGQGRTNLLVQQRSSLDAGLRSCSSTSCVRGVGHEIV